MNRSPTPSEPAGEIVYRVIAMPADTNANGDVFGGWLMAQMDLGGAVLARGVARSRIATVAVDGLHFVAPVNVGDIVTCYAQLLSIGRSSMKIGLEAWAQRFVDSSLLCVARGTYTYVAIGPDGRPQPVPPPPPPPS